MSLQCQCHIGLVVLQLCQVGPVWAETFVERHARDLATNPPDLYFRLDTPNTEHRFHVGERIPITLEFSSGSPDKYKLNGATYDRSGRLPTEEFILDREDVTDPYQDYFGSGVLGGIAGGLRGYQVLESKPHSIDLELNDWFRFDRPGRYQMYLKSHRLTRERLPGEAGEKTIQFAAASNVLQIEILPEDPGWEAAKLAELRTILDQPEPKRPRPGGPPVSYNPLEKTIALARRELRCLGTNAAVQLMFKRARSDSSELDTLALLGARERAQVVAQFDRYLADPEGGFREWDIRVRALFTFLEKDAPKPVPMFAWQVPDQAGWENIRQVLESRQQRFAELVHAEAIRLIPLATRKIAAARKASAEAIAAITPNEAKTTTLVPPDDYGLTRDELIAQFDQFPHEQQLELLTKKWDLVSGPEMIPPLRRAIGRAEPRPLPGDAMALRVWGVETSITDVALRRLNELSPEEAASIVRNDLAVGNTRFAGFAVRSLPVQDFPEGDAALSVLLRKNLSGALPLVAKFGTIQLAEQMHALYQSQLWSCAEEESFTAFFVRVRPSDLGKDVLKHAMADRARRGCYGMLLRQVGDVVWNSTIEAQAIATLSDSDPEAAISAAEVLAAHGGPAVETFLWKRLEQWSEKWRGRVEELATHPITGAAPNRSEEQLGSALFRSIGSAKSWVIDEPRRQRLFTMCVDDWCRKAWASEVFESTIRIDVSNGGEMYPSAFRLKGYAAPTLADLKIKLEQFPAGTTFRWCPQPFDAYTPGQHQEIVNNLSMFVSKHSMTIEPYAAEKCAPGGTH